MHCLACDHILSEKELSWNAEIGDWELCTTCLDVALTAAYGTHYNEDDTTEVVDTDWDEYGDDLLPAEDQRWPY